MVIFYIALVLLGSFPLLITLKRIHKYRVARMRGISSVATVTHIRTQRFVRGLPYDRLTLTYHSLETGRFSSGQAGTVYNKYKIGDRVTIAYEPNTGKVIIPEDIRGFYPMLGFSIVLLLFIIFAIFEISEMVETGY